MRKVICSLILLTVLATGYSQVNTAGGKYIDPAGETVGTRIVVPEGYQRIAVAPDSFGAYLRTLSLCPHGTPVFYYNGQQKSRQGVHCAVLDIDVGTKDLQQCADAVIRLRAEYLYGKKQYNDIHFNFTNGFRADYTRWAGGERIKVEGNKVNWYTAVSADYSYISFRKYLDRVFTYAGTLSLSKELKTVAWNTMQPGDVLIQGGSPGHAVIVLDMAVHPENGKKLFLLAQSYMPAQDIHILNNPGDTALSPWYELKEDTIIITPEWVFHSTDLKRF